MGVLFQMLMHNNFQQTNVIQLELLHKPYTGNTTAK